MTPAYPHDDRAVPETRWAAPPVFLILVPASAILWVAPDNALLAVATALLLTGAIRAFADLDTSNPF